MVFSRAYMFQGSDSVESPIDTLRYQTPSKYLPLHLYSFSVSRTLYLSCATSLRISTSDKVQVISVRGGSLWLSLRNPRNHPFSFVGASFTVQLRT